MKTMKTYNKMMSKRASNCAICDNSNRPSICAVCVNYRLNEYNSLKSRRDFLYSKLTEELAAKGKADDQLNWKVSQNEKLTNLKEKLRRRKEELAQGKAKIERVSQDLKVKNEVLESALGTLEKNRVEQLEKKNFSDHNHPSSAASFPLATEMSDIGKNESLIDECDLVECELERSVSNVNSATSSSTLLESAHMLPLTKNFSDHNHPTSAASFLFATEMSAIGNNESLIDEWDLVEHPTFPPPPSQTENVDEWDLVEHPTFPPPPSQTEDVEHWTQAMIIDATRR